VYYNTDILLAQYLLTNSRRAVLLSGCFTALGQLHVSVVHFIQIPALGFCVAEVLSTAGCPVAVLGNIFQFADGLALHAVHFVAVPSVHIGISSGRWLTICLL